MSPFVSRRSDFFDSFKCGLALQNQEIIVEEVSINFLVININKYNLISSLEKFKLLSGIDKASRRPLLFIPFYGKLRQDLRLSLLKLPDWDDYPWSVYINDLEVLLLTLKRKKGHASELIYFLNS